MHFETNEIALVLVAMFAATVLFAVTACFGFWAGTQVAVRLADRRLQRGEAWREDQEKWLVELEHCLDSGRQIAEQSDLVAALVRALANPLPSGVTSAIEQMVATTTRLTEQLDTLRANAKLRVDAPPDQTERKWGAVNRCILPATRVDCVPPRPPRIAESTIVAKANLSREEVRTLAGECRPQGRSAPAMESRRYPYDCIQYMAPWDGIGNLPSPEAFSAVRCHDISVNGVSFFWPKAPEFDMLVISIGEGDRIVLMAAKVCHHRAVYMNDEVSHLVGCSLERRLEALTAEWKRRRVAKENANRLTPVSAG